MDAAATLQPQQAPSFGAGAPPQLDDKTPQAAPLASSGARVAALHGATEQLHERLGAINEQTGALQPPAQEKLPPPPTPRNTGPVEIWGSAAMTLAAIGSLMTRQPLTTALNSAAAVMNAIKAKDTETANSEFEHWKVATDFALKQQSFQMAAYKAALAKAAVDQKGALAEFTAYAHAFGDETAVQVAETKKLQGAQHLAIDRENLSIKLETSMPKIIKAKEFGEAYKQLQKTPQYQQASGQDRAAMVAQLAPEDSLPPEVIKFYGKQYNLTGKLPNLGMKAGGTRNQILTSAAMDAFGAGLSAGDVVGMQASNKGQTAALSQIDKTTGLVEAFEKNAIRNADLALSVMDKGAGPSGLPVIDKWIRSGGAGTGDSDVTTFNTGIKTFKNEYAKIMSGATGATGSTDASRAEAEDLINPNMSKDQIVKNIAFMKKEMANRITSLHEMSGALVDSIKTGGIDATKAQPPAVGTIEDNHIFQGGNPADPKSWAPVDDDPADAVAAPDEDDEE